MAIWTDDQLIAAIRAGGPQFNQAVEYMYKKWNGYFVGYVIKNGGSKHEADDAFSHAAIDVIKQVRKDEFSLVSASFRTYFMTSFIRHWVRLYRNGKRPPLLEIDEEIIQIENLNPEEELIKKDRAERVRRALEGIGGRCIKIWLLYAAGYSWEKIAECLNIDIQTAKNQWGTCKKKLRDILLGDI